MNGKGDRRRSTSNSALYAEGHARIWGKRKATGDLKTIQHKENDEKQDARKKGKRSAL